MSKKGVADVRNKIIEIFFSSCLGIRIDLNKAKNPRIRVNLWTLPPRMFPILIS